MRVRKYSISDANILQNQFDVLFTLALFFITPTHIQSPPSKQKGPAFTTFSTSDDKAEKIAGASKIPPIY